MPDMLQLSLLISAGLSGSIAQILVTLNLRHARASLLAPFEYTWSALIGYFLMGQLPVATTIFGAMVVASAGMFAIWRERRLGRSLQLAPTALGEAETR